MIVKLLTEHHLEFLSLKGGCKGSSESTHVKILHCWKSHALAQLLSQPFAKRRIRCLRHTGHGHNKITWTQPQWASWDDVDKRVGQRQPQHQHQLYVRYKMSGTTSLSMARRCLAVTDAGGRHTGYWNVVTCNEIPMEMIRVLIFNHCHLWFFCCCFFCICPKSFQLSMRFLFWRVYFKPAYMYTFKV